MSEAGEARAQVWDEQIMLTTRFILPSRPRVNALLVGTSIYSDLITAAQYIAVTSTDHTREMLYTNAKISSQ